MHHGRHRRTAADPVAGACVLQIRYFTSTVLPAERIMVAIS